MMGPPKLQHAPLPVRCTKALEMNPVIFNFLNVKQITWVGLVSLGFV